MVFMESKEVDVVINTTLPPTAEDYTSKNRLARTIIFAALDDLHVRMVINCATAADMMRLLRERYGNKSFVGHGHFIDKVTHMRMKPHETPRAYCDRFNLAIDDAHNSGVKFADEHIALNGLDTQFTNFVQLQTHVLQRSTIDASTLSSISTELIQTYTRVQTRSTSTPPTLLCRNAPPQSGNFTVSTCCHFPNPLKPIVDASNAISVNKRLRISVNNRHLIQTNVVYTFTLLPRDLNCLQKLPTHVAMHTLQ
ncbi:hypothetical protein LEN26_009622 [Aphanomyces euteiches]|nr:hypothetical protein LEN26_009622 [Aphanomyces euteiches]